MLSIAAGEIKHGPALARAIVQWHDPGDPGSAARTAGQVLGFMDVHLTDRDFLAADHPTIADLACYAYTAHAPEGGISLDPYPALRRWLSRIEALPRFLSMPRSALPPGLSSHHPGGYRDVPSALAALDTETASMIERADTFFVASRSRADAGPSGGADISHRGGQPGFVRIEGGTLLIPDFRGNRYFNTLGNLLGEPRSSLLFLDFQTGDLLQLQGLASVDWNARVADLVPGAERAWRFRIARGWYRLRAAALRGTFIDRSPVTLRTGTWPR